MFADTKTICAVATGAGHGAISVIRVSGRETKNILLKVCPGLSNKKIESHRAYLTKLKTIDGEVIDEVLVVYFEDKKSYTGEESVEISCHGSSLISKKILDRLVEEGCRLAEPGEFTFRSYMNDKIDLVQAEAVLSLIESKSDNARKSALRQLEGRLSEEFLSLESKLTWCLAHIEASIDFSTEGIDVIDNNVLSDKLNEVKNKLIEMLKSYASGRLIKNGIHVAFVGQPNVGKSSLLNLICQNDKAIVTPIAGTTRDIVEGTTVFHGQLFHFFDTAGLRDTSDIVEKIGVEKSLTKANTADVVVFVFDSQLGLTETDIKLINSLPEKTKMIFLGNKVDLLSPEEQLFVKSQTRKKLQGISHQAASLDEKSICFVSALDLDTRAQLLIDLEAFSLDFISNDEALLSTARQAEMTNEALNSVNQVLSELSEQMGTEFVAQTLKQSLLSVQKILGHVYDDQIMDRVFKEFCIGK